MKKALRQAVLIVALGIAGLPFASEASAFGPGSTVRSFEADSFIKNDGTFWSWGFGLPVPTRIPALTDVERTFPEGFFMKRDKSVWRWERKSYRSVEAVVNPVGGLRDLVAVYPEWRETLALGTDGTVYRIPKNEGKLLTDQSEVVGGIKNVKAIGRFAEERSYNWVFLKTDGTLWKGDHSLSAFEPVQPSDRFTQIDYAYALNADGTLWKFAEPYDPTLIEAQLGALTPIDGLEDIREFNWKRVAIDGQSRLWFFGATITGFSDGTMYHYAEKPYVLTGIQGVKDAFIVERSLIAWTETGEVYETSIDRDRLPSDAEFHLLAGDVSEIRHGNRYFLMRKNDGAIWGWGVNKDYRLGSGDREFMHRTPVRVQLPIAVELNGQSVELVPGVVVRDSQAYVPLRAVFGKMGAAIDWNNSTKIAKIDRAAFKGKAAISIVVDYRQGTIDINGKRANAAPLSIGESSYLPLRSISESLGAQVQWIREDDRIKIDLK